MEKISQLCQNEYFVKAGNTPQSLLKEIRQITYSLYRPNEITKKLCNNIRIQQSYEI